MRGKRLKKSYVQPPIIKRPISPIVEHLEATIDEMMAEKASVPEPRNDKMTAEMVDEPEPHVGDEMTVIDDVSESQEDMVVKVPSPKPKKKNKLR